MASRGHTPTTGAKPPPAGGTAMPSAPHRPAPAGIEHRGRTQIAEKVLERLAAHALTDVGSASATGRRLLGTPRVDAHVDGRIATLRMKIEVVYPAPIRSVTRQVRARVAEQVSTLTGLDVREIDIDVTGFQPAAEARRRVR